MKKISSIILISIVVLILSCKKKGPYYTNVEGKIINKKSNELIPNSTIKIYNWDGDEDHDTIVLHEYIADSTGNYRSDFEVKIPTQFFFIEASREDYNTSKKIQIDGNSTNYNEIYLNKN